MKPVFVLHSARVVAGMNKIRSKTPDASKVAMRRACEMLRGYIVKRKLSGQVLKRRTGRLAGSIETEVLGTRNEVIGRVGSNLKYARIHELGGVIRPVRAEYLSFMIGDQFIRVKEVTIPKRPYIASSMKEYRNDLQKIIGRTFWTEVTSG